MNGPGRCWWLPLLAIVLCLCPAASAANALPTEVSPDVLLADLARTEAEGAQKALAFVHGQIAYAPYLGGLRGAAGTLLCGSGNSLDRALLLADLLRRQAVPVRFAHAQLGPQRAEGVVARLLAALPLDPVEPRELMASSPDRAAAWDAYVGARSGMPAGLRAPLPDTLKWARECAADHWWVQAQTGTEWVDLDPLADGGPGQSVVPAAETMEHPPAEALCSLEVEVVARYAGLSGPSEQVLARCSGQPALAGQLITVAFGVNGSGPTAAHTASLSCAADPVRGPAVPLVTPGGDQWLADEVRLVLRTPQGLRQWVLPLTSPEAPPANGAVVFIRAIPGAVSQRWLRASMPATQDPAPGGLFGGLLSKAQSLARSNGVPGGDDGVRALELSLALPAQWDLLSRLTAARSGVLLVHDGLTVCLAGVVPTGEGAAVNLSLPVDGVCAAGKEGVERECVTSALAARTLLWEALTAEVVTRVTGQTPVTATSLLRQATDKGVAVRWLGSLADADQGLTQSPAVLERIRGDLVAGNVVLCPVASVPWSSTRDGWLCVEPRTGAVRFRQPDAQALPLSPLGPRATASGSLFAVINYAVAVYTTCEALDAIAATLQPGAGDPCADYTDLELIRDARVQIDVLAQAAEAAGSWVDVLNSLEHVQQGAAPGDWAELALGQLEAILAVWIAHFALGLSALPAP